MFAATQAIDGGAGVLYLFGNYQGDVLNFGMAAEMADAEGSKVETVLAADDVASAPKGRRPGGAAVAGIFYAYKLTGAKAEDESAARRGETGRREGHCGHRSMGVALSPCTVPAAGRPTFHAWRRRDGDRHGYPRRTGRPTRQARAGRQDHDQPHGDDPGGHGPREGR